MTREDLRYHMRLPSDSRAILELGSGKELPCKVHDLSLGGAYVLREAVAGVTPSLRKGEWVHTHLEHPDREQRTSVLAEVIRVEESPGPGVALRFEIYEETAAGVIEHVNWEADRQNVSRAELGDPLIGSKQEHSPLTTMTPLVLRGAGVLAIVAALYLLKVFLGAIL